MYIDAHILLYITFMYDYKSIWPHMTLFLLLSAIVLLWFYKLWATVALGLNPSGIHCTPWGWKPETMNEIHESMNYLGQVYVMGTISLAFLATQTLHERTQVFNTMYALISSSILLSVTPAITTPTTYFRKHRIFQSLSQTRCFGSGVGTTFGSQLSFILCLGQSSKKL